ncbi:MAG: Gfo/Idh/MocA family oxidoreductase, partial [Sphingobacteriia bacterium]|nr:Gfo/Idh/MocA family oxidoreductase [Sphingobacteriia bacterium]
MILMKKIRYGLIGCGRISANHIQAFLNNKDDLELIALCDIKAEKAQALLKQFNIEEKVKIYDDYKKMIKEEIFDLISIATESGKHAEISIDCLNNKINVIVEKPMALSIKDADKMISVAKKNKVKICVSHQNRFNKSIQKLRDAYESNKFGKILYGTAHIRWNRGKDYYDQAKWRGTWEQDGGALMNQ